MSHSHRCQIDGSSASCFEHDGELWVKEYADGKQTEGRTYKVKFCPECGQNANPLEYRLSRQALEAIVQMDEKQKKESYETLLKLKEIHVPLPDSPSESIDAVKLDPTDPKICDKVRQYACRSLQSILEELSTSKASDYERGKSFQGMMLSFVLEKIMCWREWIPLIPYLKFDSEWEVKSVPPFAGAISRFMVQKGEREVSIYLDCYDCLGCNFSPYWEVYCLERKDTWRYSISSSEALMKRIRWCLESETKEKDYENNDD